MIDLQNCRTVAIIEDDPIVREYLTDIIGGAPHLEIIGMTADLAGAPALIDMKPDLFLVDMGLPDGSGLDMIPKIKSDCDAKVLVVTSFGDKETVVTAIESGADGYLLKDSDSSVIVEGIVDTLMGGAPISATAAVYLLERLQAGPKIEIVEVNNDGLTCREIDVLELFARGASYKEAAEKLDISHMTVGSHVKSIYKKLAVHSRNEAIYEALKTGQLVL